jgi:hypothetical protein
MGAIENLGGDKRPDIWGRVTCDFCTALRRDTPVTMKLICRTGSLREASVCLPRAWRFFEPDRLALLRSRLCSPCVIAYGPFR